MLSFRYFERPARRFISAFGYKSPITRARNRAVGGLVDRRSGFEKDIFAIVMMGYLTNEPTSL
jgi:hypothetical protein